ncbi:MAG: phosphodiester glycosidase family protein [Christensenellales bacterium]|jgi:hypothetical protein
MSERNNRRTIKNSRRKQARKNTFFLLAAGVIVLLMAGVLYFNEKNGRSLFGAAGESTPSSILSAETLLSVETPSLEPVPTPTPTPTEAPTPTPEPTPTPDPFSLYFSENEEVTIIEGELWEYRGPDLYVHIEKMYYEDCSSIFFVADIYTRNYGNLISGLWEESKGRQCVYPEKLARKYRAVYAQNGDFFADSWNTALGPSIRNGIEYKKVLGPDAMAFMPDCSLKMLRNGRDDYSTAAMLAEGIEHTYAFGPILVENGEICTDLPRHSLFRKNPRSAIGMVEPGHFVSILVDGRKPRISYGCTLQRLAEEFVARGCVSAYNLDGGQSTAMVFMGNQINDHKNETTPGQRRLPDMIIIGTSEMSLGGE